MTRFDALGRTQIVTQGYGTGIQADVRTLDYTWNGKTLNAKDADGNVTSYDYDGFDRLKTTTYPGGSYEQLTLDNNGQVTSRRLRDGQSIGYGYDALGHLTSKIRPNHATFWETDLSYAWDNLGELVTANDQPGHALGYVYDALGRLTSQSDAWFGTGNASFQYDAAGRRTRLTYWDGFYVTYDYDPLGEMTGIHENGGTVLASVGYDDLGRRTALGRANGTYTTFNYDGASRLTGLGLNGGNAPNNYGFGYNAAGQITSRTMSNDAYAWSGAVTTDRAYGVNGLNQYTSSGGTSLGYDGRGNLTSSGSTGYGYTSENQLASSPNTLLGYDSLGRLFNITSDGGHNTALTNDGDRVLGEQDVSNGAALRRYVYGPGQDEPLLWYEGSGTSDRRFLAADERGSIVAVSDNSGNVSAINTYDEFGIPGSNNAGRFQYTGQKWIAALGMYDYKARTYSATLGRFMQTDPIGYGDGMNWYNYVGGDPVNFVDPNGLWHTETRAGPGRTDANGNVVVDLYEVEVPDPGDLDRLGPNTNTVVYDGGDIIGEEVTVTAPKKKSEPQNNQPQRATSPCDQALQQKGRIEYSGATGSLVFGAGLQVSYGDWKNLSTGSTGQYKTYNLSLGLGLGGTRDFGHARSLADFAGYGETAGAGLALGPLGGSYSATQNAAGEWVSSGGSAGLSPSQPSIPIYKGLSGSATASAGETTISGCVVRGR